MIADIQNDTLFLLGEINWCIIVAVFVLYPKMYDWRCLKKALVS